MEEMQIQKQIGEGSFGKVYLAKWKETTVAVKILTSTSGSSDDDFPTRLPNPLLQSLEKEAGMMAAMRHPNVVLYLGVCLDPPCVVTEYCARGSLNDVLKRALYNSKYAEQLDWRVRLSMALDAAKGMNYLHTSDPPVIHRDLKSPNLLVDKHWRVKVCDFNLSRVMEESSILSSMAATNPRWLAPEILAGRGYTFSSDIYSFGIILWEFMTWRVPWHEYGPWQVRERKGSSLHKMLVHAVHDPGYLEGYCWCVQNATERPSFAEIIQVLRRLLADEARRVPNKSPGDAAAARSQQASTSTSSADTARPDQGSYREGANGAQGSGDLAVGGLRFHMAHSSSGDLRNGAQPHVPGSPGPSGRRDEPQHARSESLGSDTHLQALAGQLGSGSQFVPDGLRVGESPRSRATYSNEQYGVPGYRDGGGGAAGGPLMRREGADGSGQLSSNGDAQWDLARIHALLKEAHSDTSSNP
ncbi:kinase-like protein, partial [Coccomyxa subellipsoidea C-169]